MKKSKKRLRRATKLMRRKSKPGAPPGTIRADADASPSVVRLVAYSPDCFDEQIVDNPAKIASELQPDRMTWIDVQGLGDSEVITTLGGLFGLHDLAMEDVVHTHQRPKLETYDDHLFLVLRSLSPNEHLRSEQISIFLSRNTLLTFREKPSDLFDPVLDRLRRGKGRLRKRGADFLFYAVLDVAIDGFFPLLENCGERLDQLEEEVTQRPQDGTLMEIHRLKGDLLVLRRAIWPLRDMLSELLRDEKSLFTPETRVFLRDCYDHAVQIIDLVQTCRDLCADVRDFYLTQINTRLSEIMKVLTIIATIFIPLSFIAGLYGMNFDPNSSPWNMPELHWAFGYPAALALMAAVAGGMLLFFKRRGWL